MSAEPAKKSTDSDKKNRSLRRSVGAAVMKVPFMRHWYIKRTLKFIDKSKAKGRRLPPEFSEMNKALARVPKHQRAEMLEEAMLTGDAGMDETSRALRRAAANHGRQSGRGGGRSRPGLPPGAMQQQGRRRPS